MSPVQVRVCAYIRTRYRERPFDTSRALSWSKNSRAFTKKVQEEGFEAPTTPQAAQKLPYVLILASLQSLTSRDTSSFILQKSQTGETVSPFILLFCFGAATSCRSRPLSDLWSLARRTTC